MSANEAPGLADGTRAVVRSGSPSPEELVAILTALDAATRADRDVPAPPRPAWVRAARQESMGGRAAASPSDLGGWC
jgi:hypothetical protein